MSMVKCQECGRMVSDTANRCPYCGTSAVVDQYVIIDIPYFYVGFMKRDTGMVRIEKSFGYDKEIWRGRSGGFATFKIDGLMESIKIIFKDAVSKLLFSEDLTVYEGYVKRGKSYILEKKASEKSGWILSER